LIASGPIQFPSILTEAILQGNTTTSLYNANLISVRF
jgi:hypothetical protein